MRTKHPEAYNYLRLLWHPKINDRVEFEGARYEVARVVSDVKEAYDLGGKSVLLKGMDRAFFPGELIWRPTPKDFDAVLLLLQRLWVYQEVTGNRQIVGIACNGRTLALRGRSMQILSQILGLRVVDSKISININKVFEDSYTGPKVPNKKGKPGYAIRFSNITSKDSDPS